MSTTTLDTNEESWDEAQYEAALAHLEMLSDQVTALRTCIPSMIAPLTNANATKSSAFAGLKKAAVGAVSDVRALKQDWESESTQQLMKKAKESHAKDPDLTRASEVSAWGWVKDESQKKSDEKDDKVEDAPRA